MTFLRHSALLWFYGALGVAAGLFLPLAVTETTFLGSAACGLAIFAVCGLGHEAWIRRAQVCRRDDQTAVLRSSYDALQHEVTWLSRELVALRAAHDSGWSDGAPADGAPADGDPDGGQGEGRVDRVVAEVKVLQSLIHRLYEERETATRDQTAANRLSDREVDREEPPMPLRAEAPALPKRAFELSDQEMAADRPQPPRAPKPEPETDPAPSRQKIGFVEALAARDAQQAQAKTQAKTQAQAPAGSGAAQADALAAALAPPVPYELSETQILDVARKALRDDRVDLVLQPVVKLPQRKRRFFEAFTRMRTEDGYAILPDQYIKLAEREGLVTTIDNLLLFRCVQLVRKIQRRGDELDFFCNISRRSWEDDAFFNDFIEFLRSNLHLAENLIFEFTQLDFERWGPDARPRMGELSRLGCRFSLDQVRHLNLDPVELEREGIHFLKLSPDVFSQQVRTKPVIAREFSQAGVTLIVDKVEDEATLRELLDYDVIYAQGYLFSEPRLAKPAA